MPGSNEERIRDWDRPLVTHGARRRQERKPRDARPGESSGKSTGSQRDVAILPRTDYSKQLPPMISTPPTSLDQQNSFSHTLGPDSQYTQLEIDPSINAIQSWLNQQGPVVDMANRNTHDPAFDMQTLDDLDGSFTGFTDSYNEWLVPFEHLNAPATQASLLLEQPTNPWTFLSNQLIPGDPSHGMCEQYTIAPTRTPTVHPHLIESQSLASVFIDDQPKLRSLSSFKSDGRSTYFVARQPYPPIIAFHVASDAPGDSTARLRMSMTCMHPYPDDRNSWMMFNGKSGFRVTPTERKQRFRTERIAQSLLPSRSRMRHMFSTAWQCGHRQSMGDISVMLPVTDDHATVISKATNWFEAWVGFSMLPPEPDSRPRIAFRESLDKKRFDEMAASRAILGLECSLKPTSRLTRQHVDYLNSQTLDPMILVPEISIGEDD